MSFLQDLIDEYPLVYTVIVFLLGAIVGPMLNTVGTRLGEKINDWLFGGWSGPDYDEQDKKDEWQIYQAAFLIHDIDPPAHEALEKDNKTRPPEVEETWRKLHHARKAGEIETTPRHGAEFIKKEGLVEYCRENELRPPFLFPKER